jgi:hypothetical protein
MLSVCYYIIYYVFLCSSSINLTNMNNPSFYTCPKTGRVAVVSPMPRGSVQVIICKPEKASEMNGGIYHEALTKAGFTCPSDESMIKAYEEQEANRYAVLPF